MSYTNSTPNYNLPQWIGTDKPTFLGDLNGAFSAIDTGMKNAADTATSAANTANAASATANSANTNANTALSTANNAKDTADTATSAAAAATSTANAAKTTADNAAHAALGNNIANLAPAYDPTLTYKVGSLVTYIDENNSGKLYKCIVPVNTPMAFNVNYWDDVTTSEIYSRVSDLGSVSGVSGSSIKTLLDEISVLPALSGLSKLELTQLRIDLETGATYAGVYRVIEADTSDNTILLERVIPHVSDVTVHRLKIGIGATKTSFNSLVYHTIAAGGLTSEDKTNTNLGVDTTYRVYKEF